MKVSVSDIAWKPEEDGEMYRFLSENGADGVEIAPTRIFHNPYDNLVRASLYADMLKNRYGLKVSSMQSIWRGVERNIFGSRSDREYLLAYTGKAVKFAGAMGIKNMVFGCPSNRKVPRGMEREEAAEIAAGFFAQARDMARREGTVIALEPNPVIYGTNFLNTGLETFLFVRQNRRPGLGVNLDTGALIYNGEDLSIVRKYRKYINHIHISAPGLEPVEDLPFYGDLRWILRDIKYDGWVSVEMSQKRGKEKAKEAFLYAGRLFGGIQEH